MNLRTTRYSFKNDYTMGAHPKIQEAVLQCNSDQSDCYYLDHYCKKAEELIQKEISSTSAEVHFALTGTQANLTILSAFLRPHESIIAASSGHICVHEAGAIEATGHKINPIDTKEGKLTVKEIESILHQHPNDEHMVKPKLVYISNSTELGTVYTKSELASLSQFCKKNDLYLFMDGARIGYALNSEGSDLHFADLPHYLDAFYIGGVKNGGMLGEAIVLCEEKIKKDFRFILKQKGGLLSKSRFIGAQFCCFFENGLYHQIAREGNQKSQLLINSLIKNGYSFYAKPSTNMIFPILPNDLIEKLSLKFDFYTLFPTDSKHHVVRLVSSWNTPEEKIHELDSLLKL